jgi:hypothetical protein
MDDLVYWTARTLLVCGWLLVAVVGWRRRADRGWAAIAVCAVVFASMRAFRWNYGLLDGARTLLQGAGFYDDRIVGKLVLGGLLLVAAVVALRAWWRVASSPLRIALLGVGLQASLLLVETCSLDDAMPRWLVAQPGRYLAEGAFLVLAALGAASRALARRTDGA